MPGRKILFILQSLVFSFKKKIGETEYGLGWVPFGGYVKISGMIDESMDKEQLKLPAQPWEFRSKPAWQRFDHYAGWCNRKCIIGNRDLFHDHVGYGEKIIYRHRI